MIRYDIDENLRVPRTGWPLIYNKCKTCWAVVTHNSRAVNVLDYPLINSARIAKTTRHY